MNHNCLSPAENPIVKDSFQPAGRLTRPMGMLGKGKASRSSRGMTMMVKGPFDDGSGEDKEDYLKQSRPKYLER